MNWYELAAAQGFDAAQQGLNRVSRKAPTPKMPPQTTSLPQDSDYINNKDIVFGISNIRENNSVCEVDFNIKNNFRILQELQFPNIIVFIKSQKNVFWVSLIQDMKFFNVGDHKMIKLGIPISCSQIGAIWLENKEKSQNPNYTGRDKSLVSCNYLINSKTNREIYSITEAKYYSSRHKYTFNRKEGTACGNFVVDRSTVVPIKFAIRNLDTCKNIKGYVPCVFYSTIRTRKRNEFSR